jgi:hypothetical protein
VVHVQEGSRTTPEVKVEVYALSTECQLREKVRACEGPYFQMPSFSTSNDEFGDGAAASMDNSKPAKHTREDETIGLIE